MTLPVPPYEPHVHHRNGHPQKSQWLISPDEERACFIDAWQAGWCSDKKPVAWGIHRDADGEVVDLGESCDRLRPLWWAKFVGRREPWHGYPADPYRRREGDRPDRHVARAWHDRGLIAKGALSHVLRGEPCRPR